MDETECEPHPEYELFNTEEYRKQVFSMFGGESQDVTLLFTANILSDMFDRRKSCQRQNSRTRNPYLL